jgi:hypothetical protein
MPTMLFRDARRSRLGVSADADVVEDERRVRERLATHLARVGSYDPVEPILTEAEHVFDHIELWTVPGC